MTYTIVQIVVVDETGDTRYRMKWPAEALSIQDPSLRVLNIDAFSKDRYLFGLEADLLVLFQTNDIDFLEIIRKRREKGLKTLVEYNDNFYAPQPWSPIAKEWGASALHQAYELLIKEADGLIVTGQGLLNLFAKRFSTPVHILENHLPVKPESYSALLKKKTAYPSFGWAGSLGHMADLLAIKPVIESVLQNVPGSVFHVMGNAAIPEVLGIAPEKIRYTPWAGMDEYFSFWESVWVGLAPLLSTAYNECRSDIKLVEMGSRAVASVATPVLPYMNLISSLSLPASSDFTELSQLCSTLLRSGDERFAVGERLHKYVSENRVAADRRERFELYIQQLPAKPGGYAWPFGVGYHEVKGEQNAQSATSKILIEVQEAVNKKDLSAAQKIMGEHFSNGNPDLYLAHLKLLRIKKDSLFKEALTDFRKRYPQDLRGILLYLNSVAAGDLSTAWREVVTLLSMNGALWSANAQQELSEAMVQSLKFNPNCIELAEELLLFYPYKHSLRLAVAILREKNGGTKEAKAHFDVLLQSKKRFDEGDKEIEGIDRGYLEAIAAALKARERKKLS